MDPGGAWGPVPPFLDLFFTKAKFTSKISTKRIQNLSQNAVNGHFRDSNFQKFLGEHAPRPPYKAHAFGTCWCPPFANPGSATEENWIT